MKKHYDNDMINEINYLADCGNYTAAIIKIDEYKALYPEDKMVDIAYSEILCAQKKYEEAEILLLNLINDKLRNNKIKSRALSSLSTACYYQRKYEEAKKYIREAFELSGRKYYYQLKLLCELYTKEGNFEDAKSIINSVINDENKNQVKLILAEVLFNESNYNEAVNVLKSIDKSNFSTLEHQKYEYFLGKDYYYLKEYDKSYQHLKNTLTTKNVFYWVSYFYQACIKAKTGMIDDAVNICEDILNHRQNIEGVEDLLSSLYIRKQQNNKSVDFINGIDDDGKRMINQAKYLLQQGDFLAAEELAIKSIDTLCDVMRDRAYYLLAVIEFKLKKYDEALEYANKINNNCKDYIDDLLRMKYFILHNKNMAPKPKSYAAIQIHNYNPSLALSHIYSKHSLDFNSDINIEELFNNISNKLDKNSMDNLRCFDIYRVPVENIGNEKTNYTNVLKVVCIPDTNKILTMFPDNTLYELQDDINISEDDIEGSKSKKLSQIEKFNKKYNM